MKASQRHPTLRKGREEWGTRKSKAQLQSDCSREIIREL
jgi:hypothetical protein